MPFHWSLNGVLMISSFTSGLAMRLTCTKGPEVWAGLPGFSSTLTFCRLVLEYSPISLFPALAGCPSPVIRLIGTSSAMVLMLKPLKRLTPNGLTVSTSSAAVSKGR